MSTILKSKIVKTRKPHICFGCGRKFEPPVVMERSGVADCGSAFTSYLCQTCTDIARNLDYDDEFGFGDLLSDALAIERENKDG